MGIDSEVISTHLEVEHKIGIKFPRKWQKVRKIKSQKSLETNNIGRVAERRRGNMRTMMKIPFILRLRIHIFINKFIFHLNFKVFNED